MRHPQPYNLPKINLAQPKVATTQTTQPTKPTFWSKLKEDLSLAYKTVHPQFYQSLDGNTLYVSFNDVKQWSPYQITLWLLAHKTEFVDQIKAKDPTAFEAVNELVDKLTPTTIKVAFNKTNIIPSFKKELDVWKLPLVETPKQTSLPKDIVVEEL